jgi:hypothetical protein
VVVVPAVYNFNLRVRIPIVIYWYSAAQISLHWH